MNKPTDIDEYTTRELEDVNSKANNKGNEIVKHTGMYVFNSDTNTVLVTYGNHAFDPWYEAESRLLRHTPV